MLSDYLIGPPSLLPSIPIEFFLLGSVKIKNPQEKSVQPTTSKESRWSLEKYNAPDVHFVDAVQLMLIKNQRHNRKFKYYILLLTILHLVITLLAKLNWCKNPLQMH